MASSLVRQKEREPVRLFVLWMKERSGEETWADFARFVGVSEYSLADWRSKNPEKGMPNAPNLLRMMEAVGALSEEARAALANARERVPIEGARGEGQPLQKQARPRPGRSGAPRPKRQGAGKRDADRDALP